MGGRGSGIYKRTKKAVADILKRTTKAKAPRNALSMNTMDPFPQRKGTRMVMVQNNAFQAPNTNLSNEWVYRLNSTFAPDFTGGTTRQPYGRDTMAVLYGYYQVSYIKAIVEFYDVDQDGMMVGYQIQGDALSGLSVAAIDERPWVRCTTISQSGSQKKVYVVKIPMHTALGLTKAQYKNDTSNYAAAVGASPSIGVYLRLFCVSTVASTVSNVKFKIKLIQNTKWWQRTSLPQS